MNPPVCILLYPDEGDPRGFLTERASKDEPVVIVPQGYCIKGRQWAPYDPRTRPSYGSLHPFALALAWNDTILPDGVSRGIHAGLHSRWESKWVHFAACEQRSFSSSYGWWQGLVDAYKLEQSDLLIQRGTIELTDEMKGALYDVDPMRVPPDLRPTWMFASLLTILHGGSVVLLDRKLEEVL